MPTFCCPGCAEEKIAMFVIVEVNRYLDSENDWEDLEETLVLKEGWFDSREAAQARAEEIDTQIVSNYKESETDRERWHNERREHTAQYNREVEILAQHGIVKLRHQDLGEFVPRTFKEYLEDLGSYTAYRVAELKRSEHDQPSR